jgi:hypothetical protein
MGGSTSSKDIACIECNGRTNRDAEMPTISSFAFFQSVCGINNSRGERKCVPAIATPDGRETTTHLNNRGEPVNPLVFTELTDGGKKSYRIVGTQDGVAKKRQEIDRKHPDINWKDLPPEQIRSLELVPQIMILRDRSQGCF